MHVEIARMDPETNLKKCFAFLKALSEKKKKKKSTAFVNTGSESVLLEWNVSVNHKNLRLCDRGLYRVKDREQPGSLVHLEARWTFTSTGKRKL